MKKGTCMKKIALMVFTALVIFALIGCSAEKYGTGVDKNTPHLKVKDVFLDPNIPGKLVTLEGKISSQCSSNGCWFVLQDDTGQIFVNLPNNIALPYKMGAAAKVTGSVMVVQDE